MAADLHIHSFAIRDMTKDGTPKIGEITEDDLRCYNSHTLGSRWLNLGYDCGGKELTWYCTHDDRVEISDNVWIGEVSWLKQMFLNDQNYVPDVVQAVRELVGENTPVLDIELSEKILVAVRNANNATLYDVLREDDHERFHDLLAFLERNQGERLFTVSW